MTTQSIADPQRALEIDPVAHLEVAHVGPPERLASGQDGELPSAARLPDVGHSEAHAVDRDGVAERQFVHVHVARCDGQDRGVASAIETRDGPDILDEPGEHGSERNLARI